MERTGDLNRWINKIVFCSVFFSLFLIIEAVSQSLSNDKSNNFFSYLILNDERILNYIDESELKTSNRLGIEYENVKHKFLISYDIDENIKKEIISGRLEYSLQNQKLESEYSKSVFQISAIDYQKKFYFKDQKYISPITYYTKNWAVLKSKHFNFVISDTNLFNSYCIQNLENYFSRISEILELSAEKLKTIEKEKIYYILCSDENEIKKLTGFHTRGMYILAYDYIVTTFNAHYHELLHLLINIKLQNLPLYTHPFLQEGFAVAFGGRGGKEPNVILSLGLFLDQSEFFNYNSLLTKDEFYAMDISMSYPLSGLYNMFLFNELGLSGYLELYKKYSGNSKEVNQMKIHSDDLPA